MDYKLSIIIPHFNSPETLEKLLGSIPKLSDVQVIVVDDNSTEDLDLLKQITKDDDRCEFYLNYTGENSAGTCRNIGMEYAAGQWIMFADADDYFMPGFIGVVSEYYDSSSDIIFFPPTSTDVKTGKKSKRHVLYAELVYQHLKHNSKKSENILKYRFVSPWSKMYKRSFIVKNDVTFEPLLVANDLFFCTNTAIYAQSIEASNQVIYCITERSNTLTTKVSEQNFDLRIDVHLRRYKALEKHLTKREIKKLGILNADYLLKALKWFGIKKMRETAGIFKENKIKPINLSFFNIALILKSL